MPVDPEYAAFFVQLVVQRIDHSFEIIAHLHRFQPRCARVLGDKIVN